MTITNSLIRFTDGESGDADDVLSNSSFILNNMLNFALDGATITSQNNLKVDTFTSDTASSTDNLNYDSGSDRYEFKRVDDEFDDGSYTEHWTIDNFGTNSSITEISGYLQITCNDEATEGEAVSDGTTPIDYYNSDNDVYIKFRFYYDLSTNWYVDQYGKFGLTDGTNTVWLFEKHVTGDDASETDDSVYEVYIDASADTADLYDDGSLKTSGIDISSLGNNYYFVIYAKGGNSSNQTGLAQIRLYYLYSLGTGSDYDGELITNTKSMSNEDVAIFQWDETTTTEVSSTIEFSANGGSNYQEVTKAILQEITNTGTVGQMRFTLSAPSSITSGTSPLGSYISNYAYYYG